VEAEGDAYASWESGQILSDRYRVRECVRQSGTCHLFRVEDIYRGTTHLVLRPSPRLLLKPGGKDWFEEYGQEVLAVPPHPNLLAPERLVYSGELPFLLMEDAEGKGWDSAIIDGDVTKLPRMLSVSIQVAQALAWLHDHDRFHCNVKPANVLICTNKVAKFWKLGDRAGKTRAYASPEQLAGATQLTGATDVWSWAVSVLHMFVGIAAWPSGPQAPIAFRRYMHTGPVRKRIAMMPPVLAELLALCLKREPADRPQPMSKVVERLEVIHKALTGRTFRPAPPSRLHAESDAAGEPPSPEPVGGDDFELELDADEPTTAAEEDDFDMELADLVDDDESAAMPIRFTDADASSAEEEDEEPGPATYDRLKKQSRRSESRSRGSRRNYPK
jgi:serine/threonine protein kinase